MRPEEEGRITLNGDVYVPLAQYEVAQEEAGKWRRTLALAHMHLCFGENEQAVALIQRDTGATLGDGRTMRSLVAWALEEHRKTPPQETLEQIMDDYDMSMGGV